MGKLKPNLPVPWHKLCKQDQQRIEKAYDDALDHEEAELQKAWLKMGCIVNHEMSGYGAIRARRWLHRWKRLYRKIATFKTAEERDAYLDAKMEKIFGKGGYPAEWVDSLENGGKSE